MPDDLATIAVDKVVDTRGTICPVPILALSKAAGGVAGGGVIEVLATDYGTVGDVPAWAKRTGNEYLGMLEEPDHLRHFVRKS
jgi:tRNA 2-thiouridine synthesizing protein A